MCGNIGGTGCALRDVTPETKRAVIQREVPGLAEHMRAQSMLVTLRAVLPRGVVGIAERCLIVNLPGSPKGAVENLPAVADALPYAVALLRGHALDCARVRGRAATWTRKSVEQTMSITKSPRVITYLRLSVTGDCNLRCLYCRPAAAAQPSDDGWLWGIDELEALVSAAIAEGLTSIRLTGGEPLQRADLPSIVQRLSRLPGLRDLGLTTNGQRLAERATELAASGLRRINISLDSLCPDVFRRITGGGSFDRTWQGVRAALAAGMDPVKLNTVLLRNCNDGEVSDFAALARDLGLHVRFIELMPIGPAAALTESLFYSAQEALEQLPAVDLGPPLQTGPGPAVFWRYGRGSVGVIAAVSSPPCATCNRIRITSTGFLQPCLTGSAELDLRPLFAGASPEEALRQALREAIALKPARGRHACGSSVAELAMCRVGG